MLAYTLLLQTGIDDPNKFNGYLILGYIVMWLIGSAYLYYLYSRQRNLNQDLQLLQKLLESKDEEKNS